MKYPYVMGVRVRALKVITEGGGDTFPDRSRTLEDNGGHFFPEYVHAEVGEFGTVVGTDYPEETTDPDTGEIIMRDTIPTVAFDRTGTATIVNEDEIELVEPITLLGCDRCGSYESGKCRDDNEVVDPKHRCLEWWGHCDCGKGLS